MWFERCHTSNRKRSLKQHYNCTSISGVKFSWTTLSNISPAAVLPAHGEGREEEEEGDGGGAGEREAHLAAVARLQRRRRRRRVGRRSCVGGGEGGGSEHLRGIGSCLKFSLGKAQYREVQLDFTPEMEVSHMLFERCHTKNREMSQTPYEILQFLEYNSVGPPCTVQ